jgi:hypothetical protein
MITAKTLSGGVFLWLLATISAHGQAPKASDSSFVQAAHTQAIAFYGQAVREQAHVYEGHEYIQHDRRIKVHPYYRYDSLQRGSVLYNGVPYNNLQIQYDVVRDQLAIQPVGIPYRLRLRNEYISAFSIGPHQFARILGDSAAGVPTGFYEVLYDGNVKALTRRVKTIKEDISQGYYKADYLIKDRFFILKDGAYHEVKSKGSLLKLFPDQSKALRKYIRANNLLFVEDKRETAITQITKRYDELTHQL